LGIETPDSEILRRYHKKVDTHRVQLVVDKLHDAGISAQGCLILGFPEAALRGSQDTIDYGMDLDLDVRRWHVFQPDFTHMPSTIDLGVPPSLERFALCDVNVPDNVLPELFETAPPELLLEEHCLVRALPYLEHPPAQLRRIRYLSDQGAHTLFEIYDLMLRRLRSTKGSFNEEHYYRVLSPEHVVCDAIYERGSRFAPIQDRAAGAT
jgi:hypothetical protein